MTFLATAGRSTGAGKAASGALTIATVGAYQELFAAGTISNGAVVQVQASAATGLWIDVAGATGTAIAGTSQYIPPGGEWVAPVAFTNAVTVLASGVISFNAVVY